MYARSCRGGLNRKLWLDFYLLCRNTSKKDDRSVGLGGRAKMEEIYWVRCFSLQDASRKNISLEDSKEFASTAPQGFGIFFKDLPFPSAVLSLQSLRYVNDSPSGNDLVSRNPTAPLPMGEI